jgi:hypothetical protein
VAGSEYHPVWQLTRSLDSFKVNALSYVLVMFKLVYPVEVQSSEPSSFLQGTGCSVVCAQMKPAGHSVHLS